MLAHLPAPCRRELHAAADRYEAAFLRRRAAYRAWRRAAGDARLAASRYRRARARAWRASDDLAIKLGVAQKSSVVRRGIRYVLIKGMHDVRRDRPLRPLRAMSDDELIRSLVPGTRIDRFKLDARTIDAASPEE